MNEANLMRRFRVKHDYGDDGKWIPDHPNSVVEVAAEHAKEAAEKVCGTALTERSHLGKYRAQVWLVGGVRHPSEISYFYSP
jgi:hypothetical protein